MVSVEVVIQELPCNFDPVNLFPKWSEASWRILTDQPAPRWLCIGLPPFVCSLRFVQSIRNAEATRYQMSRMLENADSCTYWSGMMSLSLLSQPDGLQPLRPVSLFVNIASTGKS